MYHLTMIEGYDTETFEDDIAADSDAFCSQTTSDGTSFREIFNYHLDDLGCCGSQLNACVSPADGGAFCAVDQEYTPEKEIAWCDDESSSNMKSCRRNGADWIETTCAGYMQSIWPFLGLFDMDLRETDPKAWCSQCGTFDAGDDDSDATICVNQVIAHFDRNGIECCGSGSDPCRAALPDTTLVCANPADFMTQGTVGVCSEGFPGQYQNQKQCRRAGGVFSMATCDEWLTGAMLGGMHVFDFDLIHTDLPAYCAQTDPHGVSISMALEGVAQMGCCGTGAHICTTVSAN